MIPEMGWLLAETSFFDFCPPKSVQDAGMYDRL